ncbi:flagellar hook capping FlgD N-terminal domain-containing protein [Stenotrophomonas sp. HITSZ_GD]|uniref:flagellar hook capping FlgD N-terminal domain-containing protein n=1 Tax=Stenotrophomonas sp. HITSZ_GD TaxID=3037248 RepID=UPI00240DDD1B|nr:flagellar hook capping FlgD N-terminal domain-containing protein [Stenotrophomonas sp. HITSZ_GD]MDG2526869.1 flagellar hook capping FlgD N-terminal domain-containing protein [Stenotrophomonas sp. HITSZ_GD]
MSTIASDLYSSLGLTSSSSTTKKEESLGQADFLRLMTEQLQHQDPLKPMENSEFLGQLAQFSTVQGISDLNTTVNSFSSSLSSDQVLRGAQLVGHEVLVPSAKMALGETGAVTGVVAAPSAGIVNFDVTDANGTKIKTISVKADKAGEVNFQWDGTDDYGNRMAAGTYSISATHTDSSGTDSKISTYIQAPVESVTVGSDGLYLNLKGLGTAPISYVLRVS